MSEGERDLFISYVKNFIHSYNSHRRLPLHQSTSFILPSKLVTLILAPLSIINLQMPMACFCIVLAIPRAAVSIPYFQLLCFCCISQDNNNFIEKDYEIVNFFCRCIYPDNIVSIAFNCITQLMWHKSFNTNCRPAIKLILTYHSHVRVDKEIIFFSFTCFEVWWDYPRGFPWWPESDLSLGQKSQGLTCSRSPS